MEVIATLIILIYILDDVPSAFAGVGTSFLIAPSLIMIAKKFAYFRSHTAMATDNRVRYISEVIDGISTVKSYAWETPFFYLIRKLRKQEIENIASSQVYRSINQGLTFSSTTVASFVTFTVYWSRGKTLTAPVIFSVLSLLQVLKQTVGRNWTRCIETGSEAITSARRIEQFLSLVEDDTSVNSGSTTGSGAGNQNLNGGYRQIASADYAINDGTSDGVKDHEDVQIELGGMKSLNENHSASQQPLVEIRKSSYGYSTQDKSSAAVAVLHDIEFSVSRNEILMVIGPVGCGKSSLLSAVLNEINAVPSDTDDRPKRIVQRGARLAYCAQRPFVTAASVRKNITLAGNEGVNLQAEADLYRLAVESSLIVDDLLQFSAYDETEVGERGISVSGGQKARIAIARAVYSDADCKLCILCICRS